MNMVELFAPAGYWSAEPYVRHRVCNGCGKKGLGGWLVPDTLYGLPITLACDIHDWMYHHGTNIDDKAAADRAFLNNMVRIIDHHTRFWPLKVLRRQRAKKYFMAVKVFGGPAFWDNKNKPDELALANVMWEDDGTDHI